MHFILGAVLARCSQPEVGWLGWRSADDEDLVRAIADASAYDHPGAAKPDFSDEEKSSDLNGSCESGNGTGGSDGVPSLKDLSAEVCNY